MCGWNKYYRREDLRMVSDRLKMKQNNDLSITWEAGKRKKVITRLLKSASCHTHVVLRSLNFELYLESVQKYILCFT